MTSSRTRVTEIAAVLRKSQTIEGRLIVEAVGILVEAARDRLVTADGNDMFRAQGAAQALEKLYRELTVAPPTEDR